VCDAGICSVGGAPKGHRVFLVGVEGEGRVTEVYGREKLGTGPGTLSNTGRLLRGRGQGGEQTRQGVEETAVMEEASNYPFRDEDLCLLASLPASTTLFLSLPLSSPR
jgi:hypothetical protein